MLTSRLSPSASTSGCSRCFRTDADGRIPLTRDWRALLDTVSRLPTLAIQTRHTYARLVHLGPLPSLSWDEAGTTARDEAGSLHLRCHRWGEAWGRLALCTCCDSPGRIEIENAQGGEILQLCPVSGTPPAEWAGVLSVLALSDAAQNFSGRKLTGFPLMPESVRALPATASTVLPALLAALGEEQIPVSFLLRTPEVTQLREFIPQQVSTSYPLLIASDGCTTLQLALSPVHGLALGPDHSLHLAGPGGTLLLSLAPGAGRSEAWCAMLHACLTTPQ